ncbi:MAG: carboxypeptidase regulatory-like domain-containing protein [Saprospiraceae bacterium]|nr:carboxypeptidase regulatory-like domain-containing protein [Saprospiraceae bacterium]
MKTRFVHIFLFLLLALGVQAQVTTSSMVGTVTDDNSQTLIGANVIATHTPSGTTYGSITNEDGQYSIANMRVGGPYLVVISYVGYTDQKYDNLFLNLGETFRLNTILKEGGLVLETVQITAKGHFRKECRCWQPNYY